MCCERDLEKFIEEAKKSGKKGYVFYLDLDDFKHINDGLGHQYGDVLLKEISHALQSIDGIHTTCYRMGGDEFVIIVPYAQYDKGEKIIESIKDVFARPWFLKDGDYYCTMSMGTVEFPTEGESVPELIKKADIAMYEAKKSGKNRVAVYSDNIRSTSSMRLDMEKNMRDAILGAIDQFEIYYQPVIHKGGGCAGAEALVRWNSRLGFLSPSDFIPLAEYLGLIAPIGNHVLEKAVVACRYWNDHGFPDYKVNVNLSVVQLLQPDIAEIVEKAIKDSGIDPSHLCLEITESLAINDLERTRDILLRIKRLGVRFALDDFGTGYSSLGNIRALPFDVIKVDHTFVTDLAVDSYSQAFIRMIAELAEAIGADVCVEGIETQQQLDALTDMKVRFIQGFYYDKPLPLEKFEKKYATLSADN
jgi:diguanylate cyclase (GGDEF)-like protein